MNPQALMNGSPSFQASANSSAASEAGNIYGGFSSGDFTVGGDKSMIWIFVIVGIVAVAFFAFRGRG